MRRPRTAVAGLVAVALLASGCGSVNAGSAALDEIRERLEAEHGDHVVETRLNAENVLPFAGTAYGSVVLAPDTSPEVFMDVLELMDTFEPADGDFDGAGVVANGVGVCFADPQRKARLALRDALHAADASLAGEWPCAPRRSDDVAPYVGTVAELDADLRLVRKVAGRTELALEAALTEPRGTVSGPLDDVPLTLARTLSATERSIDVVEFELDDDRLRVAVTPTSDPARVEAAARKAAGTDLQVEVLLGALDPDSQDDYARIAPTVDALREVQGVDEVTAHQRAVTLRVLDPERVQEVHDAAVEAPGIDELALTFEVGKNSPTQEPSEWFRPVGVPSESLDSFAALVVRPEVERVTVREAGVEGDRWIFLVLDGPLTGAARVRDLLPVGVRMRFLSTTDRQTVDLTVADELDPEDLETRNDEVDLESFADAWNAAS